MGTGCKYCRVAPAEAHDAGCPLLLPFDEWFEQLNELAFEADFPLGEPGSYQEYYDDGDSPEETLAKEMSYADEDEDDEDDETHEQEEQRYEQ